MHKFLLFDHFLKVKLSWADDKHLPARNVKSVCVCVCVGHIIKHMSFCLVQSGQHRCTERKCVKSHCSALYFQRTYIPFYHKLSLSHRLISLLSQLLFLSLLYFLFAPFTFWLRSLCHRFICYLFYNMLYFVGSAEVQVYNILYFWLYKYKLLLFVANIWTAAAAAAH